MNIVGGDLPSAEKNREIGPTVEEAKKRGWSTLYVETPDHDMLEIRGDGALAYSSDFKSIARLATIQGNMGPNGFRVMWEKGVAAAVRVSSLHPIGPEMDEAAIAVLPSRITTLDALRSTCVRLDAAIEAAYPRVLLSSRGYGKGKLNLVLRLVAELWGRTDKILLRRAGAQISLSLIRHLQVEPGADTSSFELPAFPPAFAE